METRDIIIREVKNDIVVYSPKSHLDLSAQIENNLFPNALPGQTWRVSLRFVRPHEVEIIDAYLTDEEPLIYMRPFDLFFWRLIQAGMDIGNLFYLVIMIVFFIVMMFILVHMMMNIV